MRRSSESGTRTDSYLQAEIERASYALCATLSCGPPTSKRHFASYTGRSRQPGPESTTAQSHRASIEACLRGNFGLKRFWRTGSFGNGTSIRGYSDVDYFAVIPAENLKKDSDASLRMARDVLDARFPRTGVRVDCPAVRVPFGSLRSEAHETVPGVSRPARTRKAGRFTALPTARAAGCDRHQTSTTSTSLTSTHGLAARSATYPLHQGLEVFPRRSVSSFYLELRTAAHASGRADHCLFDRRAQGA